MNLTTLIDMIIAANQTTLEKYKVDLHNEKLSLVEISEAGDIPEAEGRNTRVTLKANGSRVRGTRDYFYNRMDVSGIYPEDSSITLKLSDVESVGLIDALIATEDESLDLELLGRISDDPETKVVLDYSPDVEIDYDAQIIVSGLVYYGTINVTLIVDVEVKEPLDLSDLLQGDFLDGFDQIDPEEPEV